MSPDVKRLTADSGELISVSGRAVPGDRFTTVLARFAAGTLMLSCDDDTDEIIVSINNGEVREPDVRHGVLADLVGLSLEYAWELRNQRGYLDGFQVRLRDDHGREETVQFEVAASAIEVRRVVR